MHKLINSLRGKLNLLDMSLYKLAEFHRNHRLETTFTRGELKTKNLV